MYMLKKLAAGSLGGVAVALYLVLQLAFLPAAVYGFHIGTGVSVGWSVVALVLGLFVVPFAEPVIVGFAVYGAYQYWVHYQ